MYYNLIQKLITDRFFENLAAANTVFVFGIIVCALVGYLLGSINFSLIISKKFYGNDIRDYGSGNAGSTNMLRTHGKGAAAATLAGDAVKTVVSVAAGAFLLSILGAYIAGFFCIIGHIFPLYFKFRGGKGVVTVAVVIAMTNIKVFLCLLVVFLIIVIGTKYVSMASVVCVLLYPLLLSDFVFSISQPYPFESLGVLFAFLIAALVTYMHRENLKRIFNHTESKISFSKSLKKTTFDNQSSKDKNKDGKKK